MKNLTNKLILAGLGFTAIAVFMAFSGAESKEAATRMEICKKPVYAVSERLYSKAEKKQGKEFVQACDSLAKKLEVPTSWLLAVMHHESKFSHTVKNYAGSKAVGLIQFMPKTARGLGTSTSHLSSLTSVEQLEYVGKYLLNEKERGGGFYSCGDLYLAVFYPKYRKYVKAGKFGKVIGTYPKKTYTQNAVMDFNKDKVLTVGDICTYFYSTNKDIYQN